MDRPRAASWALESGHADIVLAGLKACDGRLGRSHLGRRLCLGDTKTDSELGQLMLQDAPIGPCRHTSRQPGIRNRSRRDVAVEVVRLISLGH
jgi:hypothetical protein